MQLALLSITDMRVRSQLTASRGDIVIFSKHGEQSMVIGNAVFMTLIFKDSIMVLEAF